MLTENPLSWVYFPTALMLGALHALEPGHAKTLTAAYLIGIKGTKRDALLLGLSVAATHSIVVVGISVIALWLGRETFTQDVTHWLQLGSGGLVIILGLWMLFRRLRLISNSKNHDHHHGHAEPVQFKTERLSGTIEIIQTPHGERMSVNLNKSCAAKFRVIISREGSLEVLELKKVSEQEYQSEVAPAEPHEFAAELVIEASNFREIFPFAMHEPEDHDHSHMTDDEHARAHAATIPEYAKRGERPTKWQIVTFGAAGGMIPCPASITVMLLALSIGQFASGLFAVAGFSIGLAVTLVAIGLAVVEGLSRLQGSGRFSWMSANAPILSAIVVILSGVGALLFAH